MATVKTSGNISISRIHHELIRALIDTGRCPNRSELAERLDVPLAEIERLLLDLSQIHGLVLHPHVCDPWLVHPFSTTPTAHWVEGSGKSWWAPCIWCAFGIATLAAGETWIYTRFGAEGQPLVIRVVNGQPVGLEEVWVHFAIPPARAWENVHQHCAMVLPFRSRDDILAWCDRHAVAHGEDVPLHRVARFARLWYGTHADPNWHKWTIAEAQEIFWQAGFVSAFWDLGGREGEY
jgi:alkylmercury lyase-like protein